MADAKIKMSDVRAKYPQYSDIGDEQLLRALHQKHYSDMPEQQFMGMIDRPVSAPAAPPATPPAETRESLAAGIHSRGGEVDKAVGRGLMAPFVGGAQRLEEANNWIARKLGMDEAHGVRNWSQRRDAEWQADPASKARSAGGLEALGTMASPPNLLLMRAGGPSGAGFAASIGRVGTNALAGAAGGAMQPTTQDGDATRNAFTGAALGGGLTAVGEAARLGFNAVRGLVSPMTRGGQQRRAGELIGNSIGDAEIHDVSAISGARPTLAEVTPEAARLENTLRARNSEFRDQLAERLSANNAARVNRFQELAGEGGAREAAVAARKSATEGLYQNAFATDVGGLSRGQRKLMADLQSMPAIQEAMSTVGDNIKNLPGREVGRVEGLHMMKMALDDQIANASGNALTGSQKSKLEGLQNARTKLVNFIERVAPDYAGARNAFAQGSKPINSMDTAAEAFRQSTQAGASDPRTGLPVLSNLLKNRLSSPQAEASLVSRATGRSLGPLESVMAPGDSNMLRAISQEVDRRAGVNAAGAGVDLQPSNPFLELPGMSALGRLQGRFTQPRIEAELSRAMLDPGYASQLVEMARRGQINLPPEAVSRLMGVAGRAATSQATQNR